MTNRKFNKKYINTISRKRMINNSIEINGKHFNVENLIENDPIFLWNSLHTKGSKLSLCRTHYSVLKSAVNNIRPDLILELNHTKAEYNERIRVEEVKKEILKHINNGTLDSSRYRKI